MLRAKIIFDAGISRIRNIDSIFIHLTTNLGFNEDDVSDILRSEIVYAMSSLDRLIHDLVKKGMVDTFNGLRIPTSAYKNFSITIQQYDEFNSATVPPAGHLFEHAISQKHKYLSFQEPNKISEALSLIWDETHKWQRIATTIGTSQSNLKTELKNIVIRRNQIVHESDFDLSTSTLQTISHSDTIRIIDFVEELGHTIISLVT